tara:strand:+ start:26776 stop:27198 length:423 start_codon:yes stop_codon:yes gene_type:complete
MICTKEDSFLEEKTIWVALLSSGQTVFQDDGRSELMDHSAWVRLMGHCEQEGVYIEELKIKFRSHVVPIPKSEGYHFIKGIGCMVGFDPEKFFIVGTLNNGELKRTWYKVPEIVEDKTSNIAANEIFKYESLIIKGSTNG